jgi:hypothetical protein
MIVNGSAPTAKALFNLYFTPKVVTQKGIFADPFSLVVQVYSFTERE